MFSDELRYKAFELLGICRAKGFTLTTAESCTGGLIAALLTEIPGSSDVFERGFVTYSNASKNELLGVPRDLLETHGAVSYEVAEAMARGAVKKANVDIGVSVTGIAGPGGATPGKPVGLVFIGIASRKNVTVERHYFYGSRRDVREQSVTLALKLLRESLSSSFDYVV